MNFRQRKNCRTRGAAAWMLAVALATSLASAARAEPFRCADTGVTVVADSQDEIDLACQGATDAIGFMRARGMQVEQPFQLHLVGVLPEPAQRYSAAGCYVRAEQRAYVLRLAVCRRESRPFDLPLDRTMYRSVIAHEVAHAIAGHNFAAAEPGLLAQEYVAYVTQLAVMPAEMLNRILAQFPGTGFESEAQMELFVLLMDPNRFAVEAYRHFSKPENGTAFLRKVLTGRAIAND